MLDGLSNGIIYLYFILLIIAFVIFALFSGDNDECDVKRGGKKGRECDGRIGEAAEGAFIILSLPLLAWIIGAIVFSLAILAFSMFGCLRQSQIEPYVAAI